ncbi:MAG: PBP1A family penicillin-binding protein [Gemmatimonadota bacterium]
MMARAKPRVKAAADGIRAKLERFWYPRETLLVVSFLGMLSLGGAWGVWKNLCAGDACPSVAQIKTFEHDQKSRILTHDGVQISEIGFESRTPVELSTLPPYVAQAVIATEDKRFYRHGGFDPLGIARAIVGVLTFNRDQGGGSTITQQLARNMFDEIGFDRRYIRKLKEVQVAIELESSYTKDQILEAYLNEIYMGRGYGFQSAAERYLGKDAREMNVAEAALLTAILNVPGRYDPFRFPDRTRARRDLVLNRMVSEGFLASEEAERWKQWPLPETEPEGVATEFAPYFGEWVRQLLDDRFGQEIYSGGYRVYTTLDFEMQRAAEAAMQEGWAAIESDARFEHPAYEALDTTYAAGTAPYLQGAFVALDPATGHVRALVGGRDFNQSKFDRARQARRQAGSSFKPFVYTAAIQAGIPASYVLEDNAVVYPQLQGEDWRPANFGDEFKGPMTIREGLYSSTNMIAIKLGWEEVGIESVAQTAQRFGIRTPINRFPSTTIGAAEVIPLQVAEAYSAFPNLGTKVRPFPILRVEDDQGNVIWEPQPERTEVLDSLHARIMVDMLQDVVRKGTGWRPVREVAGLAYAVPAAGKTGTTNDGTDIWFAGFTPNLLATVWFGMDQPQPIFRLSSGTVATGGGQAAPVWGNFMRRVYQGVEEDLDSGIEAQPSLLTVPNDWPVPSGLNAVLVDNRTGQLASRWCPEEDQYLEYYVPGTEPTELCDRSNRRFRFPRVRGWPN